MNLTKKIISASIPVLLLAVFLLWTFIAAAATEPEIQYRSFTKISSLSVLDDYAVGETDTDPNIKGIKFEKSYCKQIEYNGKAFTVRAYIFYADTEAEHYFKLLTGRKANYREGWDCCLNSNTFFDTDFVMQNDKTVYHVSGGKYSDVAEFIEFMTADFPVERTKY